MVPRGQPGGGPAPGHLPWWGAALAALGFAVLLALVASPVHADPASAAGPLAVLADHLSALLRQLSACLG